MSTLLLAIATAVAAPQPPAQDLLICDFLSHHVVRFDPRTSRTTVWIPANAGGLVNPHSIARARDGHVLVVGEGSANVVKFDARTGAFLEVFIRRGVVRPVDIDLGADGDVYVLDFDGAVRIFDGVTGRFRRRLIAPGAQGITEAEFLELGPDGTGDGVADVYVTTAVHDRVFRFDGATGAFVDEFVSPGTGGLRTGQGHRFRPDGYYVANGGGNTILRFDPATGALDRRFVRSGAGLSFPHDIAFDASGDLYVTEPFAGRVTKFDGSTGQSLGVILDPGNSPLRAANAMLFVPDDHPAVWENYGDGVAGTTGVPALTALASPALGNVVRVELENSLGAATFALFVLGNSEVSVPLPRLGGSLLAAPDVVTALQLPPAGAELAFAIPFAPELRGVSVFCQTVMVDAGGTSGLASSRGLRLDLGDR